MLIIVYLLFIIVLGGGVLLQVYANGSALPFMIPPFAAGGSSLYPVMRPVKVESDW